MAFTPLSELYGWRVIYITTLCIGVIFIISSAVLKKLEHRYLACRASDRRNWFQVCMLLLEFLYSKTHLYISAPIVGGTLADLWRNEE